jgi:2'-5' RNA ligase
MRLFYAITFDEAVRRQLREIQEAMKTRALRGNYTLFDNLHLTLVFIGEVAPERTAPLVKIAEGLLFPSFNLRIQGVGSFRREGGQLVWAGVAENGRLGETYDGLSGFVRAEGFKIEERRFTPHLTLAREVRFREDFSLAEFSRSLAPIEATVKKVSLMKSERLGGKLVYTEIA